jgi:hypothetical protein
MSQKGANVHADLDSRELGVGAMQTCGKQRSHSMSPIGSTFLREAIGKSMRKGVRRNRTEHQIAVFLVGDFEAGASAGREFLSRLSNGEEIIKSQLILIAKVFSAVSRIRLPRDYTRRSELIIKWFNDHLPELEPLETIISLGGVHSIMAPSRAHSS